MNISNIENLNYSFSCFCSDFNDTYWLSFGIWYLPVTNTYTYLAIILHAFWHITEGNQQVIGIYRISVCISIFGSLVKRASIFPIQKSQ